MMKKAWIGSLALLVALVVPGQVFALEIGEPAPPLTIKKWVKGEALDLSALRGKVVIVEFWATWCGPCKASIPHLTELQTKMKSAGLVIVGVSDEEPGTVERFVREQGSKMDYTVAVDDNRKTNKVYMQAVGANGIPRAFLIDKEGNLAWHGSPFAPEMESLLVDMFAGSYDPVAAKKKVEMIQKYRNYLDLGAYGRALKLIDQLIDLEPQNRQNYEADRLHCMIMNRRTRKEASAQAPRIISELNNPNLLAKTSWRMMTEEDGYRGEFDNLALQAARKAHQLNAGDWEVLRSLAYAEFLAGNKAQAIALQQEAIKVANPDDKKLLEKDLKWYQE